ncbi:MAG: OmpA family protein [Saprospiraceae bacterium]
MNRLSIILLLCCLTPLCSWAQKDMKEKGDIYFENHKYYDALNAYLSYTKTEKDPNLLIKRGYCYLKCNQPDACIADMLSAHEMGSMENLRFKYSAMAYFAKGNYQESAKFYKAYLAKIQPNHEHWQTTILEIKKCGYALSKKHAFQIAYVEQFGGNVNTEFDEFKPNQSPNFFERYYFSSSRSESTGGLRDEKGLSDAIKGHYSADIYQVNLVDGNWDVVLPFGQLVNSAKHDIIQDISPDGSIIYYTKGLHKYAATLYTDTFSIEKDASLLPLPVKLPFNAEAGDKDLHIFNDSLILFSSIKNEGYGGYDIYYCKKNGEVWAQPINMGSSINSAYNEISPCLLRSGQTLYFSSDKLETLGGYDIFRSTYSQSNNWETPTNLYQPVNSPGDDIDFKVSADGMTAIFASDRIDGKGGLDLYMAYFKDQIVEQFEYVDIPEFLSHGQILATDTYDEVSSKQAIVKDFLSKPLYFRDNEDIFNPSNQIQIKNIIDLLTIFPKSKVVLSSHTVSEGKIDFDLFFSIKRVERIAQQLVNAGIQSNRIYMIGCGSNYPIALPYINGIPSTLADKNNKRIDVDIISDDQVTINVIHDRPAVSEEYRDNTWYQFNENNQNVTFRVQFAEVAQMVKSDILILSNEAIIIKKPNEEKYTYTLGNYLNFDDALFLKKELSKSTSSVIKIVPYHQGIPIEQSDIQKLSEQYDELIKYMNVIDK